MKVYFINLDRTPERLGWFTKQVHGMAIELVRVPAADAKDMSETELQHWRGLSSGRSFLSAGEIGCFLSHRKAWEKVVTTGEKWAFIAEDDIHFSKDAEKFLSADTWIPKDAELIKAETNLKRHELSYKLWGMPFGHELRRLHSLHWGSGGYFLTPEAALRLLAFTERRCEPVDALLFSPVFGDQHQLSILQLNPAICIQDVHLEKPGEPSRLGSVIHKERVVKELGASKTGLQARCGKIIRELKRVGRQMVYPFRRTLLLLLKREIVKRVTFDGP